MKYIREKPFNWLKKNLDSGRILLLLGPRQVGKTTLLRQFKEYCEDQGRKSYFFSLEDLSLRALLDEDPKNIFQIIGSLATTENKDSSKIVVCIDEIQYLKNPSNFLKYLYDMHGENIKIVVTGSSAFYINKKFSDSLAGRKHIYEMMSLDFQEFLTFRDITQKDSPDSILMYENLRPYYYEYLTYGGYPAVVLAKTIEEKKELLKELAYSYTKKDVLDYDVSSQDDYLKIMKVLAGQVGGLLNIDSLYNILDIPRTTVSRYINIMNRSYHIATVHPYFNNLKKELKKMPKVFFLDLGLRNFLMGNFGSYDARIDKGALLENAVFLALLSKYEKEEIYFWRTHTKQEVDFVIPNKIAYEVKQSLDNIDKKKYLDFQKIYTSSPLTFVDFKESMELFW